MDRPGVWEAPCAERDRELAEALARREEDAAVRLREACAGRLYDFALMWTGEPSHAERVVHDCLVDAVRRAARARDRRRLTAWLYASARRALRDRHVRNPLDLPGGDALALSEREVLLLTVRHALTAQDLAVVLETSPRRAGRKIRKITRRARAELADGLRATPTPTPPLPAGLDARITHTLTDAVLAPYRDEITGRSGNLTDDGTPHQPDAPPPLLRRTLHTLLSSSRRAALLGLCMAGAATMTALLAPALL
ncbi:RNA polymerase sigma factor, partial [Actinocorallia lasiicapitis]